MGIVVEKHTLQAMMLEILLKDKDLLRDILAAVFKENPNWVKELTVISAPVLVNDANDVDEIKPQNVHNSEANGVSDAELDFWVNQHFKEYEDVFKALA
jgi:hypothetical protein